MSLSLEGNQVLAPETRQVLRMQQPQSSLHVFNAHSLDNLCGTQGCSGCKRNYQSAENELILFPVVAKKELTKVILAEVKRSIKQLLFSILFHACMHKL